MADANAPKKTRKSSGPRQQRPVFAIVSYTDENGTAVKLNQAGISIQIERDSGRLVELLTGGGDFGNAAVVRVELPQPATRKTAEAPAA